MLRRILLTGLPLLLVAIPFFITRNYVLYPQKHPAALSAFSDNSLGGHSEILKITEANQKIFYRFHLNQGYISPYAGMIIQPEVASLDISLFDTLKLELNSNLDRLRIDLHFQIPHGDLSIKSTNTLVVENWINVEKERNIYSLNLKDFKIPHWWYNFYNINQVVDHLVDFRYLSFLEITASDGTTNGYDSEIIVEQIRFSQSPYLLLIILIVLLSIYYSLMIIYLKKKMRQQKTPIPANHLPSETMNDQDNISVDKILTFMEQHYKNPDFCLDMVIAETGLSPKKLNHLLKEKRGLSFIKYLNRLRLESARLLLQESKQSIIEIAYQCGFNNHTHFHRCFKEKEGISPGEFRKQKNK